MAPNLVFWLWTIALGSLAASALAHDGPPYPIIADWKVGPMSVTVWADPDVGDSEFYITLEGEAPPSGMPGFTLTSEPADGRMPARRHDPVATRGGQSGRLQVLIHFPKQEDWIVTAETVWAGAVLRQSSVVAVTPPGLGKWDLAWYAVPFLAVGVLWTAAMFRPRGGSRG